MKQRSDIKESKMPEPRPNETQQEYVSRCIPYVIKNEGADSKQAAGKCYGMYRHFKKNKIVEKIDDYLGEEGTCTSDIDTTVAGKGKETTKSLEKKKRKKIRIFTR